MERTIALKKLGKLIGKKLGYRIDSRAPTPEEREAARAEIPAAAAERDRLKEKRDERHKAILAADVEYQNLFAAHKAANEKLERLWSVTRRRKITVGTSEGMFFIVKADGDSWEEIFDKLEKRKIAA